MAWSMHALLHRLEVVLSCLSLGEVLWIESFIRIKEEVTCVLVLKGFLALSAVATFVVVL